jgi:hypothetical protein
VQRLFDDLGASVQFPGLAWEQGDPANHTPPFRQHIWLLHEASPVLFEEVGRLGVPPFGSYNSALLLPAGTPLGLTSARRFDALLRSPLPVKTPARVDFFDARGGGYAGGQLRQTALIPFTIT